MIELIGDGFIRVEVSNDGENSVAHGLRVGAGYIPWLMQ